MVKKRYIFLLLLLASVQMFAAQTIIFRANHYTIRDGLASNVVNCGVQDRQGYIWLGTNQGLTRFDGHRFENFYVEENGERRIEGIRAIVEDTVNNVLLMRGNGYRLLCFDLEKVAFVSAENMEFPKAETDKAEETGRIAERAAALGVKRGNITHRRHDMHHALLADGREVFTTIDNGFYIYDPRTEQLHHFCSTDTNPVVASDYINDVFLDSSGSMWLATTFAGIYQLDLDEGELVYHALPGSSNNIRSFSELPDTTLAVGDMDGNVFRFDPRTGESRLIFRKGPRAYAMRTDKKGRFWVGTRGGGVWVDDRHLNATAELPVRQIFDVCLAPDCTAWIGSFDGGLIEAREQSNGTFSYTTYLPEEKIHQMLIDRQHRLWVATESGIFLKEGTGFRTIYDKGKVVCVTQGPADTIYAGSNGYGLLIFKGDSVRHFTTSDGLANNCVEAVAVDDEGNVIAATDQGVSVISHSDWTVHNVYSPRGLVADTYNEDAAIRTSEGRIFLGSQRGLAELKTLPSGLHGGRNYLPRITSVEVNDVARYDGSFGTLSLRYNQNNLRFNFSSFAYKEQASIIYEYWLEGMDSRWRASTKESFALYTGLRPGNYRFHVRYRVPGESWSKESVCEVIISQPWWWTWWARMVYLLLIALVVWYEWSQYQQRLSLRRQLDQRLTALYAVETRQESSGQETGDDNAVPVEEETAHEKAANQKNREFLDKLDHLILQNLLQTDLDVNFIAQEMCVSYSTLHRRIKSLTGMSANEYVRKHRLAKAMQMLRSGHSATEVSMLCGFNSPSYFTRCFKSEFGILPSEI